MTLTSERTGADGERSLHPMRYFDLDAEGVRQWGEASEDGGASGKPEFDLLCRNA